MSTKLIKQQIRWLATNLLYHYLKVGERKEVLRSESNWASLDFDHFLDNIPKCHSHHQLYMFSQNFDIDEAFEKIMGLDFVMLTESFDEGLKKLSSTLDRELLVHREKSYQNKGVVSPEQTERARALLAPEYQLLEKVKACHPALAN